MALTRGHAPDHHQAARDLGQGQDVVAREPEIGAREGRPAGHRTRRQEHVARLQLVPVDSHNRAPRQPAAAADHLHPIGLQQGLHALAHSRHDPVLAGLHSRPVGLGLGDLDAEFRGVADGLQDLDALDQGLSRYATDVEAGAAPVLLLDDGDLRAHAGGVDGCYITAGARADDGEVEVGHEFDCRGEGCWARRGLLNLWASTIAMRGGGGSWTRAAALPRAPICRPSVRCTRPRS